MKSLHPLALGLSSLLLLGLSSGLARSQDERAQSGALDQRVSDLEQTVAALEKSNTNLEKQLHGTLRYLEGLAQEGLALSASLDQSEQLGFTAGINPRSREVLLGALRSYMSVQQTGLPKAPPVTPVTPGARRR